MEFDFLSDTFFFFFESHEPNMYLLASLFPSSQPVTLKAYLVLLLIFQNVLPILVMLSSEEMRQYNADC